MENSNYSNWFWQDKLVRLRNATSEDWKEFYNNCFDNEARFFFCSIIELPLTAYQTQEYWENYISENEKYGRITLSIENFEGINVGFLIFVKLDERNGTFNVGMQIGKRYRGKGYGTAALKIALDYAFNERRLHKYQTFVIEGNVASSNLLKKQGCIQEGIIRETTYHQGRYWNEIHYGLTSDEFNKI